MIAEQSLVALLDHQPFGASAFAMDAHMLFSCKIMYSSSQSDAVTNLSDIGVAR